MGAPQHGNEGRVQIFLQRSLNYFFYLYIFFGEPTVHFSQFFPLLPLTEVSPRPSAIPGGNPSGDGQSVVGWAISCGLIILIRGRDLKMFELKVYTL
jgi:hypothetical protein